jgi:predicted MFS family arabinose efflux permease
MIQRQQTLWLILATAAAILSFMFPFVTGKEILKTDLMADKVVDAGSNFFILLLTGASVILSTVIIFLFKDRKLQMKLCLLGILIAIGIIVLYILQMNKLTNSTIALFAVLPFAIVAGYFLAFRNIRKDERLVKSLDKLR